MKPLNRKIVVIAGASVLALIGIGCAADEYHAAVQSAQPALYASAGPATQPAETPAPTLPSGHPDIDAIIRAQSQQTAPTTAATTPPAGVLPKGHPDISGLAGGAGALPSGHPDISGLGRGGATTRPIPAMATLDIRAVQGTAGAAAIGAEPITVEARQGDQIVGKLEAKLDENGTASVSGIPTGEQFQSTVKVTHGGVEYMAVAQPFEGNRQQITVPVYEPTDQAPAWSVKMRHVIVEPTNGGVQVIEMLAVANPIDHAWVGAAGADGKRTTFAIDLPTAAKDVQLGGAFHECCVKVENGKVTNSMALVPGTTEYQLAYILPADNGNVVLTSTAPAKQDSLMIFVPDDGSKVTTEGLQSGAMDMGGGKTRYYTAGGLATGQSVKLAIDGVRAPAAPTAVPGGAKPAAAGSGAAAPLNNVQIAKAIAGAGAAMIVLLGGAAMFMRSPAAKSSKHA
jgi:hypothetical protein